MSKSYRVASNSNQGAGTANLQYATVEDALRSLKGCLVNDSSIISIIDSEGQLVLPADQVRLRLHPKPEYVRAH